MIARIETRLGRIENRQEAERKALEETGRQFDHLSRPELEAAVVEKVTDMLTCHTMAGMRVLFARSPHALRALDAYEGSHADAAH